MTDFHTSPLFVGGTSSLLIEMFFGESTTGVYKRLPLDLEEKGPCFKAEVQIKTVEVAGLSLAAQSARAGSIDITGGNSIYSSSMNIC